MKRNQPFKPAVVRTACNTALTQVLEGLDPGHYPESLRTLLHRVLLPESPKALRSTALLTATAASWRGLPLPEGAVLAAQEMFLRGWFLQAELLNIELEAGENVGLGHTLAAGNSPALLLLAADTLFTLPFEVLARGGAPEAAAVSGRLAGRFGPAGLLRNLDQAGESLEAFLQENPLLPLATAAVPQLPDGYAFAVLARYCYLREARDWFGRVQAIGCGLQGAQDRRACLGLAEDSPPGSLYAAVYKYLGK